MTEAFWAANGKPDQDAWEVWVQLTDDPDLDHPELPSQPTRASVGLSDDDATNLSLAAIAIRLACNTAAHAAHETLERTTFHGEQIVDPHLPHDVRKKAARAVADKVYEYLMLAPTRTPKD